MFFREFHVRLRVHVCLCDTAVARRSDDGVTDTSHQLSDINRQETAGHQHYYYIIDNSSTVNRDPQYQEVNVDNPLPVVYQELAPQ